MTFTVDIAGALSGAEGFVSDLIVPPFNRHQKDDRLVFVYELLVHQSDPETLRLFGREITYASDSCSSLCKELSLSSVRCAGCLFS